MDRRLALKIVMIVFCLFALNIKIPNLIISIPHTSCEATVVRARLSVCHVTFHDYVAKID